MTLIKCADCRADVSDQALACPKCGRPVSTAAPPTPEEVRSASGASAKTRRRDPMAVFGVAFTIAVAALVILLIIIAASDETPTVERIQTSRGRFAVPGRAFLDGRDFQATPPLTVARINIWDGVARRRPVCSLRHGTSVEVLSAQFHTSESRYYFHVRATACEGWVPESFMGAASYPAIGDQM